jgi:AcrR family transcriptional regulator
MTRGTAAKARGDGPRRSGLLQDRSRRTRHELVRAALALWEERGFEHGIEETTVEEIAQAAGVTKGTFYFHFAHKEDILLEMGIETAQAMMLEVEQGIRSGRPAAEILQGRIASLARRIERAPRTAVIRSVSELSRRAHEMPTNPVGGLTFATAFAAVASYGVDRGELPDTFDPEDFGAVLQAVVMDTIIRWAKAGNGSLRNALQLHTDIVVAGMTSVYGARDRRASSAGSGRR